MTWIRNKGDLDFKRTHCNHEFVGCFLGVSAIKDNISDTGWLMGCLLAKATIDYSEIQVGF